MEDHNKIIESLNAKFTRSSYLDVVKPVSISNYYDFQNIVIFLKTGKASFGKDKQKVSPGEVLFIPGGKATEISFGEGEMAKLSSEDFFNKRESFVRNRIVHDHGQNQDGVLASIITVTFDVRAFDSVSFFTSLDLPPFVVSNASNVLSLINKINAEWRGDEPGKLRLINLFTDELVIEVFRYILSQNLFVEELATNSSYFKDPRLIDIFNYIKENLSGDLSNKVLANVANVSEDYVGQYFKMLTGINPQDYIEYQRMEKAVELLRTSKKSIRSIGTDVGYKDTAYFCRRFKMMFGIPAGKMRRRESLIDI